MGFKQLRVVAALEVDESPVLFFQVGFQAGPEDDSLFRGGNAEALPSCWFWNSICDEYKTRIFEPRTSSPFIRFVALKCHNEIVR